MFKLLYHAIIYHTLYHTIHYTIPYRTLYHTIPYHTIPYHTIPYHTIPYHTIPYHTIPPSQIPSTSPLLSCHHYQVLHCCHTIIPLYPPSPSDHIFTHITTIHKTKIHHILSLERSQEWSISPEWSLDDQFIKDISIGQFSCNVHTKWQDKAWWRNDYNRWSS